MKERSSFSEWIANNMIPAVAILIGISLFFVGGFGIFGQIERLNYPVTDAIIISTVINEDWSPTDSKTYYQGFIQVEYKISEEIYVQSIKIKSSTFRNEVQTALINYVNGTKVSVNYNPNDPTSVSLSNFDIVIESLFFAFMGIFVLSIGFYAILPKKK